MRVKGPVGLGKCLNARSAKVIARGRFLYKEAYNRRNSPSAAYWSSRA